MAGQHRAEHLQHQPGDFSSAHPSSVGVHDCRER
jgi:hypothetical protein